MIIDKGDYISDNQLRMVMMWVGERDFITLYECGDENSLSIWDDEDTQYDLSKWLKEHDG